MLACLDKERGTCGFVVENLDKVDDVVVGHEHPECLYFFKFFDLVDGFIFFLHALDGDILVSGDGLGHENF